MRRARKNAARVADRPTGTVTVLFSDIEGSTRLVHDLGPDRYRSVLEEHRDLMRTAISEAAGFEVDTQGDAFFVAFHRAQGAVSFERAIDEALSKDAG